MKDLQSALDARNHDQIAEAFTTGLLTSRSTVTLLCRAISKNLARGVALLRQRGVRPVPYYAAPIAKCRSIEIFELVEQARWPLEMGGLVLLSFVPYDHLSIYRTSANFVPQ